MNWKITSLAIASLFAAQAYVPVFAQADDQPVDSSAPSQQPPVEASSTLGAKEILVNNSVINTDKGQGKPALVVNIPESSSAVASKIWEGLIGRKAKAKPVDQGGVFFLSQALITDVAQDPVNVYYSFAQQGPDAHLTAAFESNNVFVSPEVMAEKCAAAQTFLRKFAVERYTATVGDALKVEKKKLSGLESELKGLYKEKEKLEATVSSKKSDLASTERDAEENKHAVKTKSEEVISSRQQATGLSGDLRAYQEKTTKALERDRDKLEREAKSIQSKIASYNSDIEKAKRDIEQNLSKQPIASKKVEEQRAVVKALEDKLSAIK